MIEHEIRAKRPRPNVCTRCGSGDVRVVHQSDVVDFKGLTLEVQGLAQTECSACGLTWATAGQEADNLDVLRAAFALKRDELRASEGLLRGEEIERVLELLSLSKAHAAELFGGGVNAFGKYMSGEVLQSVPMDRLLRLAVAFGPLSVSCLEKGSNLPLRLYSAYQGINPETTARLYSAPPVVVAKELKVTTTSTSSTAASK